MMGLQRVLPRIAPAGVCLLAPFVVSASLPVMTNVVLKAGEFAEGIAVTGLALPSIMIATVSAMLLQRVLPAWKIIAALTLAAIGGAAVGIQLFNTGTAMLMAAISTITTLFLLHGLAPRVDAWPRRVWLLAAFDVVVLSASATRSDERAYSRRALRSAFELSALPAGARNVHCATDELYDIHQTCTLTLAAGEFATLTANTRFTPVVCATSQPRSEKMLGRHPEFVPEHCYQRTDELWQKQARAKSVMMIRANASHTEIVMNRDDD